MKKKHILIAAFAAILTLMVAFSNNVFAATGKNVTIEGIRSGDEVKLCKIIEITKDESNNTIKREFVPAIKGINIDAYSKLQGPELQGKLWDMAAKVAKSPTYSQRAKENATSVVFENVDPGQYIVLGVPNTPLRAYQITTITVDYKANDENGYDLVVNPAQINIKSSELTEPKKELEKDANLSEEITYKITATVPTYPKDATFTKFTLTDNMAGGMLINPHIVSIKKGETLIPEAAYTTDYVNAGKDSKFEIAFNYKKLIETASAGSDITITYKATIDSVNETDGTLINQVIETINPNPYIDSEYKTPPSEVKTQTFGIVLKKVDAENHETKLPGAVFGLFYDEQCTNPVVINNVEVKLTTDGSGYASVQGIKTGIYWVKELKAPAGYRLDSTARKVPLTETSATEDNPITNKAETNFVNMGDILNNSTPSLPITGGPGTAALTFIGVGLMGCYFVGARKNKE